MPDVLLAVLTKEEGKRDIVVESRIDDCVAVLLQAGRFDAAWNAAPAVEEENFHGFTAYAHRKCRST